jgi:hypothetical protein
VTMTAAEYAALRDECVMIAGIVCLVEAGKPHEPLLVHALGRFAVRAGAVHRMLSAHHQARGAAEFDAGAPRAALLSTLLNEQTSTGRGRKAGAAHVAGPDERDETIARLRVQHERAHSSLLKALRIIGLLRDVAPRFHALGGSLRELADEAGAYSPADGLTAIVMPMPTRAALAEAFSDSPQATGEPPEGRRHQRETATRRRQARAAAPTEPTTGLHATAARILTALATFHPGTMTRVQAARVADMAPSGGAFCAHWTTLRQQGLIEERAGRWAATAQGVRALGSAVPRVPKNFSERVGFWCERLKAQEASMLRFVVNTGSISRTELARAMEMKASGGAFCAYLSTLTNNMLVERNAHGLSIHPWLKDGPR